MEIFNTHLTFNRDDLYSQINNRIAEKVTGYVCVCDSSVIARLQHDLEYRKVIHHWGEMFDQRKWDKLTEKVCFHKLAFRIKDSVKATRDNYYNYILNTYNE